MLVNSVRVNIHLRWWVHPYLNTLKMFCFLFGTDPNIERIGEFIAEYGMRFELDEDYHACR